MKRHRRFPMVAIGLVTALLLTACSGGPGGPGGLGGPGSTGSVATEAAGGATPAGAGASRGPGAQATPAPGANGATLPPDAAVGAAACDLLTAAQIQAATGGTLVTAVPAQQLGIFPNGCLFETTEDGATTSINVGVMAPGGRAYWDANLDPSQVQNGYGSIAGLGDAAVNARAGAVMVVAGDVLVSVQYFGPTGPDPETAAEIARQLLAGLAP